MKKSIYRRIILLLLLSFLLYKGYQFLITEWKLTYKINGYKIEEHYYKENGNWYDFIISKNKENYTFTINHRNKEKKLIQQIKTYKRDNLVCIIPIYKKNQDIDIYCNLENEQVSKDYLRKIKNLDFEEIIKEEKLSYEEQEKGSKYKNIEVYNDNILKDQALLLWNYKGLFILKNDSNTYKELLDYDLYDNVMATVVDNYYVLFENTSVNGIEKIFYYDLKKGKWKTYQLKEKISKDSYINGVIDSLIYLTDQKEKKQYIINISKEEQEEVSKESYILYEGKTKKLLSKSDFFKKEQYFQTIYRKENSIKEEVIKEGNYKYFQKENKIYKSLVNNKEHPILLLELEDIKQWQVIKGEILLLKEDTLFSYTDKDGLRKVLESNELKYNYKNIYKLWKK